MFPLSFSFSFSSYSFSSSSSSSVNQTLPLLISSLQLPVPLQCTPSPGCHLPVPALHDPFLSPPLFHSLYISFAASSPLFPSLSTPSSHTPGHCVSPKLHSHPLLPLLNRYTVSRPHNTTCLLPQVTFHWFSWICNQTLFTKTDSNTKEKELRK